MNTAPDQPSTTVAPIPRGEALVLAETAYRRFAEALTELRPEQWSAPTPCDGWTVRDLAGHMVGAMRAAASVREFVSLFAAVKRRVRTVGGTETDAMTQIQIERTADLTVDELVAECAALVSKATAGRRRTPAALRRFARIPVEIGSIEETWTLGYLMDTILTRDAWLHRMDLSAAIGVEPILTPEHDGRIVADVAAEWARRHGRPCRLVLTGPAGGHFTFGATGAAADTLELDAVEFCRILSGRAIGTGLLATEVPF